jgi:hypothetical protein
MKKRLQTIPFFILLLPVFFVLHGFRENLGYIHPRDALLLTGIYLLGSAITFTVNWLLYKNVARAGMAAVFLLAFYFFFGALHDFLKARFHPLSHYTVVLPLAAAVAAIWMIWLRKTPKPFRQSFFYLNLLFSLYILFDLAGIALSTGTRNHNRGQHRLLTATVPDIQTATGPAKPDIYLLIFDAYTSSTGLKDSYHYDNSEFDRFLTEKRFRIQTASHSNYKYTILSIPSILNMDYLNGLKDVKGGPLEEYYYLSDQIKDNEVCDWLQSIGYDIVNCSIFDLKGHPSPATETLLPLQTKLITDQTLYSRFYRDVGWNFYQFTINPFSEKVIDASLNSDNKLIGLLESVSATPGNNPRFVYGHFNIPHPPYYFDKTGARRKVAAPYRPEDEDRLQDYLDYLTYTNKRAEEMIGMIMKNTNGRAVIILMGDHGLRYHDKLGYNPVSFVRNQNAVYFPDGDYHLLYDSISGVNQFRVVLNSLFGQHLPLLKDSIVNVKDKK